MRHTIGDQIGDGLALAGAGWPFKNKAFAIECRLDGSQLRGIRDERCKDLGWSDITVKVSGHGKVPLARYRRMWVLQHLPN